MIRIFTKKKEFIEIGSTEEIDYVLPESIWIDLYNPEQNEIKKIEDALKLCLPTKDEMYGLEVSNRLYQENDDYFMTGFLIVNSETPRPEIQPVCFIVAGERLVTVRYIDPQPFKSFVSRKDKVATIALDGKDILMSLLENIVERVADILEKYGHEVDDLSIKVFKSSKLKNKKVSNKNFERILKDIGRCGGLISKSRESLTSILRLVGYIKQSGRLKQEHDEIARAEILDVDIKALIDHAGFINNKINFLLDATLGMISIQQNDIIKIFTVATMMFLPPTLIASIYGMNFEFMPEIHMKHGYYLALLLMLLSAFIPYKLFKKKGWL